MPARRPCITYESRKCISGSMITEPSAFSGMAARNTFAPLLHISRNSIACCTSSVSWLRMHSFTISDAIVGIFWLCDEIFMNAPIR